VIEAAFSFVMVVITFVDIDHKLILNLVTFPSAVIFYAATFLLPERHWYDGLIGAAIGYGVPWLIGEIYFRITDREGLGLGDSTLLAVVGAVLGWRGVVFALFGGSVIGSVIGITVLVLQRQQTSESASESTSEVEAKPDEPSLMKTELPFGPFLAMAALFYLFAAPWISLHFRL
jgi:leader peptidase (prepilin peptidase)/N-methyltransferase